MMAYEKEWQEPPTDGSLKLLIWQKTHQHHHSLTGHVVHAVELSTCPTIGRLQLARHCSAIFVCFVSVCNECLAKAGLSGSRHLGR